MEEIPISRTFFCISFHSAWNRGNVAKAALSTSRRSGSGSVCPDRNYHRDHEGIVGIRPPPQGLERSLVGNPNPNPNRPSCLSE